MPPKTPKIEDAIDKKVGEVRIEGLDLSFGEIMSLLSNKELDLYPDFQRYFRWTDEQRSRLIESILLGLAVAIVDALDNKTHLKTP